MTNLSNVTYLSLIYRLRWRVVRALAVKKNQQHHSTKITYFPVSHVSGTLKLFSGKNKILHCLFFVQPFCQNFLTVNLLGLFSAAD